jgi:L-fuconolactonase
LSDRPRRPWDPGYRAAHRDKLSYLLHAGQTNSTEMVLTEMAEVGVDRAVLSPIGVYGNDNSYELEGAATYPTKFGVVGWIDYRADDVEQQLAGLLAQGVLGLRIPDLRDDARHERGQFDRVLAACSDLKCTISLSISHPISKRLLAALAHYADLNFVIDHLGTGIAPPVLGNLPPDPFEHLPAVLGLARLKNVHVKLTGAPALSRELFPFRDIWQPIHRILEAFGPSRVMWGSDYTRTSGLYSYWDGTHYLHEITGIDAADLALLYGGTLRRVFGWPSSTLAPTEDRDRRTRNAE